MQIIKKGYSVNPWRLVDSKGLEIEAPSKTILQDGAGREMRIAQTISGRTKKECTEKALALLELHLDRLEDCDHLKEKTVGL